MKIRKILLLTSFLVLGIVLKINAQQFPMQYLYDQYKYMINPAAIKIGEGVGVNASFSNHWNKSDLLNFNDKYIGFGVDAGFFQKNMGLGLVFSQEIQGILRTSNIQFSYAYGVQLAKEHWLTFGVSAGFSAQVQNTSDIITGDYDDELLYVDPSYGFLAGFGINYRWKGLEIDVVIPSYNTLNKNHFPFFFATAYQFELKNDWRLKPLAMYSLLTPGAHMGDFRIQAGYKDWAWLQVGYRTTNEILVFLGGSYKNFSLAVGGGFNVSSYRSVNKGNLEVVLGYRFKNAKIKRTRAQFEDQTEKYISKLDSNVSALVENEQKRDEELKDIKGSIVTLNKELKEEYKESLTDIKETVQTLKKEEIELDESKIIDKQYFVVVYSTKTPEDADKIVNRMAKQNVKGHVLKDASRSHYYIYTENYIDLDKAMEASQKERERGFSGAWVLIVK